MDTSLQKSKTPNLKANTILAKLTELDGNVARTAQALGITRAKIYRTLEKKKADISVIRESEAEVKVEETQVVQAKESKKTVEKRKVVVKQTVSGHTLYSSGKPMNNPMWEAFCQYYVAPQTRGKAIEAYMYASKMENTPNNVRIARNSASRWLQDDRFLQRIRELMDIRLTHELVDQEHAFLVMQHEDLKTKLGAIKHYNELMGRVSKEVPTEETARDKVISRLFGDVEDAEVVDENR